MATLQIDVPAELNKYLERRVREGGYGSVSQFVCELIESDQRDAAHSLLEAELLRGLDSGPSEQMTPAEWNDLRREIQDRAAARAS